MIRNLVFDMGNVLIHYDPHHFIQRSGITDPAEAAFYTGRSLARWSGR